MGEPLRFVSTHKLGTGSECILLPRFHDELGGHPSRGYPPKQSVGAIILARVMEVCEFAGKSPKSARAEMSCLRVGAMLFWSTVMVICIDLYRLYHLS